MSLYALEGGNICQLDGVKQHGNPRYVIHRY